MNRIIKYGSDVAAMLGFGKSTRVPTSIAIYKAAKSGQTAKLEELLVKTLEFPERHNLVDIEDLKGRTPLIIAVVQGQIDCVALLLTYGADVHHMNWSPKGGTALHEAIQAWTPKNVIMLLLRHGASPFVENIAQNTPWEMAMRRRDASLFRMFERYGKFCQYLLMKVVVNNGGEVDWVQRWVSIIPRYAYSRTSREKLYLSMWLLVFEDTSYFEPIFQLKIDTAEAWLNPECETGTEVVLTPPSPEAALIRNHLIADNGKDRLRLTGSDTQLSLLMKAVTGQAHTISSTPGYPQTSRSCEEDLLLAKRLQAEFDREAEQNDGINDHPSRTSGAGPSTCGTSHDEHNTSISNGNKSNLAEDAKTGIDLAGSSSQGKVSQTDRDKQNLCVVCLDAPKSAGFAHGNSVHWCVCKRCAQHMWTSGDRCCPLCRMTVDNIITDFYAG